MLDNCDCDFGFHFDFFYLAMVYDYIENSKKKSAQIW